MGSHQRWVAQRRLSPLKKKLSLSSSLSKLEMWRKKLFREGDGQRRRLILTEKKTCLPKRRDLQQLHQLGQNQEVVLPEGGLRNPRRDPMCPLENQEDVLLEGGPRKRMAGVPT